MVHYVIPPTGTLTPIDCVEMIGRLLFGSEWPDIDRLRKARDVYDAIRKDFVSKLGDSDTKSGKLLCPDLPPELKKYSAAKRLLNDLALSGAISVYHAIYQADLNSHTGPNTTTRKLGEAELLSPGGVWQRLMRDEAVRNVFIAGLKKALTDQQIREPAGDQSTFQPTATCSASSRGAAPLKAVRPPGRKPHPATDLLWAEMARRAYKGEWDAPNNGGISQADAIRQMLDWLDSRGQSMNEETVRDKVRALWTALGWR